MTLIDEFSQDGLLQDERPVRGALDCPASHHRGSTQHGRKRALGGLNTRKTDKTGVLWVDRIACRRS